MGLDPVSSRISDLWIPGGPRAFLVVVNLSSGRALPLVKEMESRYELLKETGVRNVAAYNALGAEELYRRLGAPEAIELFVSPEAHEFTDEMRNRAYHWFDRWL